MSDFVNTLDVVGDEALTDSIIDRSITEIADDSVTSIGGSVFYSCSALTSADFPVATSIGDNAFNSCSALTSADFPVVTSIGTGAFGSCRALTSADFPVVTRIGGSAFYNCSVLTSADFPVVTSIGTSAFADCSNLTALILRKTDAICTLSSTTAFNGTPIKSGTGYVYVPAALKSQYEQATNWSSFATQFRVLEDYTVDGTTTGELDPNKI